MTTDNHSLAPTALLIDHFEPLTLTHMQQIIDLSGQTKKLHVLITTHPKPNPNFNITLADKARWLQMACADLPFIHIHTSTSVLTADSCDKVDDKNGIDDIVADFLSMTADTVADTDNACEQDLTQMAVYVIAETLIDTDTDVKHDAQHGSVIPQVDTQDQVTIQDQITIKVTPAGLTVHHLPNKTKAGHQPSHQEIHANPAHHWHAIHPKARGSYTKTVAIVGGESSGKTTLLHKLVNHYGASHALEMGRLFVQTDLGGSEVGMQYDDYPRIATDHEQAIREAVNQANAPVTFVDTDFVTTQAFCEEYEGRTHPFLTACIETFRLDHTIMLDNNTPWVADGMRSLGSDDARNRFKRRLNDIFARHGIEPHCIDDKTYHQRYLAAVRFVDKVVFGR